MAKNDYQYLMSGDNLELDTLLDEKSIDKKRIYDRVLDMCVPVRLTGISKRKGNADDKMKLLKELKNRD